MPPRGSQLSKIVSPDPVLNRIQDHLLATLNPVIRDALAVSAWGAAVATAGDLRDVLAADRKAWQVRLLVATPALMWFDPTSLLAESASVVRPADVVATSGGRWVAVAGSVSYQLLRAPQLLTDASGTYTTPAQVRMLFVECVGGGGGGGGATTSEAASAAIGGGGAAGGYACASIVTPAATYAYDRGAFGTAGGNPGGTGGDTTFGATVVIAKGGLGGVGQTAGTSAIGVLGGAGQTGGAGDVVSEGMAGLPGWRDSGTAGYGGNGACQPQWGIGGMGAVAQSDGGNGTGYGSGGGGACSLNGGATQAGGKGRGGVIRVWEYI